jgi:hypothetical protein
LYREARSAVVDHIRSPEPISIIAELNPQIPFSRDWYSPSRTARRKTLNNIFTQIQYISTEQRPLYHGNAEEPDRGYLKTKKTRARKHNQEVLTISSIRHEQEKSIRASVIGLHIHKRKIGARKDQIAELLANAAGAAAALCVATAEAALVAPLAVSEIDDEPLPLLLLLEIFLPLPLPEGEIAGEAVMTDASTARVGFHFEALPSGPAPERAPDLDLDPDPDPDSESDSDLELEPESEPPPRPLKMAPAMPVTESVPTWWPEITTAVVAASAVDVTDGASSADTEGSADA